jgi:hypothetical protein
MHCRQPTGFYKKGFLSHTALWADAVVGVFTEGRQTDTALEEDQSQNPLYY